MFLIETQQINTEHVTDEQILFSLITWENFILAFVTLPVTSLMVTPYTF